MWSLLNTVLLRLGHEGVCGWSSLGSVLCKILWHVHILLEASMLCTALCWTPFALLDILPPVCCGQAI